MLNTNESLKGVSFTTANSLYKDAVTASPNNAEANFGAGLSEILMITNDTSITNMINRWQGANLSKAQASAPSLFKFGIPTDSDHQSSVDRGYAKSHA